MISNGLSLVDYILFGLTLSVSTAVGIYFGFCGSKQKSATEYLYGNRNMKAIPVGLSLYSSAISAITIAGTPGEVYVFGTQHMMTALASLLSLCVTWYLVLPVFCNLEISTPYEYLQLRYNSGVRMMSSFIYVVHTLLYMPLVLYATTSSFSEASGIPLAYCTTVVGGVCVFYTVLGGFKSVIWTDTIQATLMLTSCIFIMVFGFCKLGGFNEVWARASAGGRINFFNMDPNPLVRITFWSASIGFAFNYASHSGCSAGSLQRYMSLSNEKQARISTVIGAVGYSLIAIVCGLIGVCIYVYYQFCDPIENGDIKGANVIVSHFVTDVMGHIPGFSGFFVAGVLCAGLSTMSAELNTVGGVIYHDVILKIFNTKKVSESRGAFIMKIIVLLNGLLYIVAAPYLENIPYLFQISQILTGLTYGAKLGIIVLGTTFPKTNSMGAVCGAASSVAVMAWISIGAMYYNAGSSARLPMSTANCGADNTTLLLQTPHFAKRLGPSLINSQYRSRRRNNSRNSTTAAFFLYKLSHMHYSLLGTIITMVVALAVSHITGVNDVNKVDPRLLIPCLRRKQFNTYCIDEAEQKLSTELKVIKSLPVWT